MVPCMSGRRVALVTGAGRGIGRAVARRLAEDGLALAVNDVDDANAGQAVEELLDMGFEAVPAVGSVAV
ncbi:MAG: SDR family NAD(P)-dependent oxidoreductase, partial [Dehalococcoidia bacterium]|nr:SDR family NAD(P)-dependent oxidoreductase [Dehalococcoidia bacterium]